MQPSRPAFLQPGEAALRLEGRHPMSALDSWLGLGVGALLAGAAAVVLGRLVPEARPFVPGLVVVALALALAGGVAVAVRVRTSVNVVTAERVYHAHGRWRFLLVQTTYDRVTDLHVRQSLFGRWFGYGTVHVVTAGGGVSLVGVRDPLGAKQEVEVAREAMVRRLVGAHKAHAGAAAGARKAASALAPQAGPGAGRTPLWQGGPTVASVVTQLLPMAAFLVVILAVTLPASRATGPIALAMPGILLAVVAFGALHGAVRLRTERYEVHAWGVAVSRGWLSRSRVEARYEKVTDVVVTQNVLGRMFGFGVIRVNTAGSNEAPIGFVGVADPDRVKALIDAARRGEAP